MTKGEGKGEVIELKGLLARDEDFVRAAVEALVQAALEAEMTEAIGAAKGERSETRLSYRSGYYSRSLITRVGTLELRVPQDRMGRFSTELFERYQRSEKALVGTLAEMYVQGRRRLPNSSSPALSQRERAIRQRLKDDLEHYAARCLKIRTKAGTIEPLTFNRMQRHLHARIEAHAQKHGRVRVLILKARQQGCSTYVGARFYHKATHARGQQVFILTHEQDATDNLFDMAQRFHEHCPELVKPHTGAANAKELAFDLLDSGYSVGTAGSKAVGRSKTLQLFFGSEVAFWPNAAGHFAGVMQAVPPLPSTEIILESTGHGIGGEFHERWQMAEAGLGDFEAIFIPWFWSDEYRREVPLDFTLSDEEQEYSRLHDLSVEEMAWRRFKIDELRDPILFMQEYPATAAEAFQFSGHDSFIKPEEVMRARKTQCEGIGPLIIGADPARFGDDRFSLAWRKGRKVYKIQSRQKVDTVAGANCIKQLIDVDKPARVFIDLGGVGAGTFDILRSWGSPYDKIVVGVNFGGEPQEPTRLLRDGSKEPGPKNRRAEMWARSKEWLNDPAGADIPDSDSLHADACGPGYSYDMNQRLLLESKEHMRARGIRSPDEWDAVALTFAAPVRDPAPRRFEVRPRLVMELRGSNSWMAA